MCVIKFEITSPRSKSCSNPMLKTVEIVCLISPEERLHTTLESPFQWEHEVPRQTTSLTVTLKFSEGADEDKQSSTIDYDMELWCKDKYMDKANEFGVVSSLHKASSLLDLSCHLNQFAEQTGYKAFTVYYVELSSCWSIPKLRFDLL